MIADALRLAFGTLTTWRVRPPTHIDRRVAGWAMALAPVAVAPLAFGCGVAASVSVVTGLLDGQLAAALVLAALALSTRGMHLDGLADLADGLCGGVERERSLAIMKRSDTGAGGVAAMALVLLVQFAALSSVLTSPIGGALLVFSILVSRHVLAWACRRGVPAASDHGLGATVSSSVSPALLGMATAAMLAVAVAMAGITAVATLDSSGAGARGMWAHASIPALAVLVVGVGGAMGVVSIARRRLGGITGDVLGAAVEVAFAAALVTCAVAVKASAGG